MATWKENLPGYEFKLWDFDRFDMTSSIWVKQAFEAKKYASAADFIRLFAVFNYGGIYLDMDIEVLKPFDGFLQNSIMIAWEDNRTKNIEAGCFGADKGHPFIKACLDYFISKEFSLQIVNDGYTLPRIMKKIYMDNAEFKTMRFYSADYFTAKRFRTGIIKTTPNTYAIHHFAGSWFSDYEKQNRECAIRIVAIFGDTIFSVVFILCVAFFNRIKRQGLFKTISYYIKKFCKD